ncbi:MAG: AI-2E family transporter [Polyangiales bacterium]
MREEQNAHRFYTVLVAIAVVLVALVVWPFAEALFLAAVLAGAIYPVQTWFTGKLGGRKQLSAAILTTASMLLILGPIAGVSAVLVKNAVETGREVVSTLQEGGVPKLIEKLPGPVRRVTKSAFEHSPIKLDEIDQALKEKASAQQGQAAQTLRNALTTTGSFALQLALMTIALFFLLVDGPQLVAWCEHATPLREGQTTEVLSEFRTVSVSVIVSSVATGVIQALAALLGYLISGVSDPFLWMVLTFFTSFIPAIGAGSMCVAAAALLLANGKVGMAIFLAAWGVVAVGLADNLIKPLLAKRSMRMHGGVVFFALVGGIAAFGTIGLILGPLVVSFLVTLVRLRRRGTSQALYDSAGHEVRS